MTYRLKSTYCPRHPHAQLIKTQGPGGELKLRCFVCMDHVPSEPPAPLVVQADEEDSPGLKFFELTNKARRQ